MAADIINTFSPKLSFIAVPRNRDSPYKVEADIIPAANGVKKHLS